jgi:hypothetical protein
LSSVFSPNSTDDETGLERLTIMSLPS